MPGDTWPMCALSRGQLCLHDQDDLDTPTAELLAVVHQAAEPAASCSGCGRRSPRPDRQPWPGNRHGWRPACSLTPSTAGCLTRHTNHRDRRQGGGAGVAAMPGPSSRSAGRRTILGAAHKPRERRQRSDLRACSGPRRPPHNCAFYGPTSTLPTARLPLRSSAPQLPGLRVAKRVEVGLGWLLARPPGAAGPVLWHNGGTGGFRSFLAFVREAHTAVVVLSNTARSVDRLGLRLLKALAQRRRPRRWLITVDTGSRRRRGPARGSAPAAGRSTGPG